VAESFRWGLLGPGRIANRFAHAVRELPGCELAAIAGRDAVRAQEFASRWAPEARVFGALDAMLALRGLDAVYIATPHGVHFDAVAACLRAGVPVLCEKSLAVGARQARALVALSHAQGVFLMEALWTRFLPLYETVGAWLAAGAIGEVRGIQSSFAFNIPFDPSTRHWNPALGGGAMFDIGIYNLSMAQWVLRQSTGAAPVLDELLAEARLAPTGVDAAVSATLRFNGGVPLQFQCAFDAIADNGMRVFGERGVICVQPRFWEATAASLRVGDDAEQAIVREFAINGFEGEILEAMTAIRAGQIESVRMPHADTVAVAEWIEAIHAHVGMARHGSERPA
jgi:predicted dehydrogenase